MSLVIRGDSQLVELEPERNYSVRDGWRSVRRWKGLKESVNAFIPSLIVDGINVRVIPEEGPLATVEAWFDNAQDGSSVSDDSQIVTTWSVVSNELEQSILESDAFDAIASAEDKSTVRDYLDGKWTYAQAYALVDTDAQAFVDEINAGRTSFAISQIVLRRTKIMSGYSSAVAYLSNANKVYSRAQLITAFSPPAAVQSEMPATGEWLARNGTKEQQSNGKWVVTLEWWHGDRISSIYPRVS